MRYSVQNPYTSFTNYEPIHLISFKSFNRINDLELFQTHALCIQYIGKQISKEYKRLNRQ